MALATQRQAKSMAQQRLGFDYNQEANSYLDKYANAAKQDRSEWYDKTLNDSNLWAQNSQSIKTNQGRIDRETDNNQNALQLQQRQSELAQQNRYSAGGSSSTAYGTNAPPASGYTMNERGQSFFRPSQINEWQYKQGMVAANNKMFSEADAAGDVLRTKASGDVQQRLATTQAAADAARQAQQNSFNAQQAAADRASQERMRVLQGYSINPGSFQYWGGGV